MSRFLILTNAASLILAAVIYACWGPIPRNDAAETDAVTTREADKDETASIDQPAPIRLFTVHREGRPVYVLSRKFRYCFDSDGAVYEVPRGFATDFASIPFPASRLLAPDGRYARAAIIHDYLYAVAEPGMRKRADDVLDAAMKDYGVGGFTRAVVYRSVRVGGKKGYGIRYDWSFYDPSTLEPTTAPPKPAKAAAGRIETGCASFNERERTGEFILR